MESSERTIVVNGRNYRAPIRPTVVICLDGSEPGYIEEAIIPRVQEGMARTGRVREHFEITGGGFALDARTVPLADVEAAWNDTDADDRIVLTP